MATKKKIVEELRAYKGSTVGGLKPDLQKQLEDFKRREAAGEDVLKPSAPETAAKTSSAESRRVSGATSPNKTDSPPLPQGEALSFLIFGYPAFVHSITIQCLTMLKVTPWPFKPTSGGSDIKLGQQLMPVKILVKSLTSHAQVMTEIEKSATASRGSNLVELSSRMRLDFDAIDYDVQPEVLDLFTIFGGLPAIRSHEREDDVSQEYQNQLQTATAASIQALIEDTARQEARALADIGSTDRDNLSSPETMEIEIPPDDQIIAAIPETGISLATLAEAVSLSRLPQEKLINFQNDLLARNLLRFDPNSGLLFLVAMADKSNFPSDEHIQIVVSGAGNAGIDFLDLIKILDVRRFGEEKVLEFHENIISRNVVAINGATGGFILGSGPIRPRDSTDGAAGVDSGIANQSPTTNKSSHPRLSSEIARIKTGILSFMRLWFEEFPEPTVGVWPEDFGPKEKTAIRKVVQSYVCDESNGMLDLNIDDEKINTAVDVLLAAGNITVAKACNKSVVTAVVKTIRNEKLKRKKAAAQKQAEKAAGDVQDAGDNDNAAEAGWQGRVIGGTDTALEGSRKRARDGEDDGDSEDEDGADVAGVKVGPPARKAPRSEE